MLSIDQKARLRALSVIAAVIWVVLGLVYQWPVWLWSGLAVVSLLGPSLAAWGIVEWNLRKRPRSSHELSDEVVEEEPQPMPEPPMPQQYPVQDVLLRSAHQDYRFVFACTVFWRLLPSAPGLPHPNPGALAADLILVEAANLAASIPPEEESRARYRMMNVLGSARVDRTGHVEAWADGIALSLSEKDVKRLTRLAEVRKDEEVWEHERSYERNVRAYLGDDVLTSPGSAVVWWLAGPRTDEKRRVDEAVEKISNLQKLTSAAAMAELPGNAAEAIDFRISPSAASSHVFGDQSSSHTALPQLPFVLAAQPDESGNGLSDRPEQSLEDHAIGLVEELSEGPEREMFARRLADLLEAQGRGEAAEQVRRRFDAPLDQSAPDEDQDADERSGERNAFSSLAPPGVPDEGVTEQPSEGRVTIDSRESGEVVTGGNASEPHQQAGESLSSAGESPQQAAVDADCRDGERPV
jgi:hypothetical protein